jgi:hypothetical protein
MIDSRGAVELVLVIKVRDIERGSGAEADDTPCSRRQSCVNISG